MTHEGATDEAGIPSSRGGPMALPGRYRVWLRVDSDSLSTVLDLITDPRAVRAGVTPADLRAQATLALRVRDAVSTARQLTGSLRTRRTAWLAAGDSTRAAAATRLLTELETAPGRYQQPMLTAQLQYLYGMLVQADQRPGRDAEERFATLTAQLSTVTSRAEALNR
jgi:hypothetical protein